MTTMTVDFDAYPLKLRRKKRKKEATLPPDISPLPRHDRHRVTMI